MPDDHATAAPESPPGPNTPTGGFTRSRTDRMIAGVAGGLAARLDVDPLVVRAAFVILSIAGGSGLVLYLLGWLLLPEDGEHESIAGQFLASRPAESRRGRHTLIAVLIAVVLLGLVRPWQWSLGRPAVAILVVLAIVAFSRRRSQPPGAAPRGFGYHGPGSGPGTGAEAAAWAPTETHIQPGDPDGQDRVGPDPTTPMESSGYLGAYSPTSSSSWAPPAPRLPSLVPPLLAGLAALTVASAVIGTTGWVSVPLPAVIGVALVMSVAALIAGTLRARFVGAALISLALAGLLLLSTAVPHPLAGGVGVRTWHPAAASDLQRSYRLGAGRATLDLSDVGSVPAVQAVRASVGAGDLTVIIPAGDGLQVRERANVGDTDVLGDRQGGLSVDRSSVESAGSDQGILHLDLQVGIGTIEVRRAGA